MSLVIRLVVAFGLVLLSAASWAQLNYYTLIDSDSDAATGCTVTLPTSGAVAGVERRLTASVSETATPQVAQLTLESCVGGSFAAPVALPGAPYPVGSNNGVGGADVVEQAVEANAIAAPGATVRLYFAAQGPTSDDLLGSPNDPPILLAIQPSGGPADIPFLSGPGFLVLALLLLVVVFWQRSRLPAGMAGVLLIGALAGIAWAAGFRLDGQIGDWQGVPAVGSDAGGDSAPNTDIVTAFAAQEGGNLFFRTDIANAETSPSTNQPPSFTSTPITAASVASPYSYTITTRDPDGNILTLTAPTLPAWLTFAPGANGTGTLSGTPAAADLGPHNVVLRVTDNGSPSLGADQAFTITVGGAANPAPTIDLNGPAAGIDFAATFTEGGGAVAIVDPANLAVSDPDSLNLASATVTLTNLLDAGQETVAVSATTVAPNTPITSTYNPATGVLALTGPAPLAQYQAALRTVTYGNAAAAPTTTPARVITFVVSDGGNASVPATATVILTGVNDAPSFTAANPPAVNEDGGPQTVNGWVTAFNPGPADESAQTALAYTVSNVSNAALFSTPPSVNASGNLSYTPAPNAFGASTFDVRVQDSGGTASGGVDTSAPQTFTITVNGINDQPSFTASNPPAVNESAGPQTVPGWATFNPGNPQESAQTVLAYTVSNVSNTALFSVQPSVAANGNLTYTPAAGANGTSTFEARVQDSGGIANGGVDTSAPQAFTITVNPVDDPPTAVNDTATVTEDDPATTINVLANDTDPDGGPRSIASVQTSSANGGTVVITNGGADLTYQPAPNYCNNPPGTGLDTFTYTLAPGGSTGTVTITVNCTNDAPVLDLNGPAAGIDFTAIFTDGGGAVAVVDAANLTVADVDNPNLASATVTLTDRPDGAVESLSSNTVGTSISAVAYNAATGVLLLNGPDTAANFQTVLRTVTYNNTSPNPNTTARSITFLVNDGADDSAIATSAVTVNSINSAPSFTKGADQNVLEDAGAQTVNGWATAIGDGDGNTGGQILAFQITGNTNAVLFSAGPAISATGVLTYTPAANANGSATITLVLKDDGGTANGGVDTSAPQSFTIAVNAINDAPSFTAGPNQTVNEDAGPQTVNSWATGVSAGPTNESGQTLTFNIAGNTNSALFSAGPAISSAGVLTYTPAANASGSAAITVTLSDSGGTANGGVDTSASQIFTITVNAANDAPSFTAGPNQTVNEDAGPQTVNPWATGVSAGPANESGQTLTFNIAGNTNSALFSAGPAISSTGVLTYTPAANASGSAAISVTLSDNGGTANGGVDTSAPQSFTITVNPVNDPPVAQNKTGFSAQANMAVAGINAGLLTGVTDADAGVNGCNPTFSVASITANTGGTVSNVNLAAGTFDFEPTAGFTGTAVVNYAVQDDGCPLPAATSAPATISITVSGPVIWFVDASVAGPGDGRLSNPFKNLTGATSADAVDAANQRIFVFSGTYASGITLNSGEWLIGQGVSGASFDAVFGITPPLGTIARPSIGGTRPTLQNTVTMDTNSQVKGLNIASTTNAGITASGKTGLVTGEVSVTTTTGAAANFANSGGTLSFTSISANGGTNGIVLNNTTGSFTVTGTGAAGSGGTIQNMTGLDGATDGIGVYLSNAQNVSLNWMQINDHSNFAIRGDNVTNFAMDRTVVSGANGTNPAATPREASVLFNGLFGTGSIINSTVSGGIEDNIRIENTTATPLTSLTVSGTGGTSSSCQIRDNSSVSGNIGFRLAGFNNANMAVTVTGCLFTGNRTDAINIDAANTASVTSTVTNNYVIGGSPNQGNLGINVTSGATGTHAYTVSNDFVGTDGVTPASLLNTGINLFSGNGSTLGTPTVGFVQSNTVRNAGAGSGHGVQIFQDLSSTLRTNVNANTVSNVALDFGIRVEGAGDPAAVVPSGEIQAGVTNNNSSVLTTALDAIRVRSRRTIALCSEIRANTTNAGGTVGGFFGLFTNQANTSTFSIEGLAPGAQTAATAQTYLISQNPAAASLSATAVTNYTGVAANACAIP